MIERSNMKNLSYRQAIILSGKYGRKIAREYWQTTNQGLNSDEYIIVVDNGIKHSEDWDLTVNDILAKDWYLEKGPEASEKRKPRKLTYNKATKRLLDLATDFRRILFDILKAIADKKASEIIHGCYNTRINQDADWMKITGQTNNLAKALEQLSPLAWFFREQVYDYPELLTKKEDNNEFEN